MLYISKLLKQISDNIFIFICGYKLNNSHKSSGNRVNA